MRNANSKSLCDGTRREVIFNQLHVPQIQGTPYNVFQKQRLNNFIIAFRFHVQGTPENVQGTPVNDWYAG